VIEHHKPQLIFLDVMMPKKNGYEVCRTVKQEWGMTDTHVILLTAKGQLDDRTQGMEAGADQYMTKPFDPDELLARSRQLLGLDGG
jgi:two-component system, OmpR family, alkaline phosphatase synthesis response regulator PhoP